MRELTAHKVDDINKDLSIIVTDDPGHGGANHVYSIEKHDPCDPTGHNSWKVILKFQSGPIKEHGVNGITEGALLEIIADRLRSFQAGEHGCRENAIAILNIETAQLWLHKRTLNSLTRVGDGPRWHSL